MERALAQLRRLYVDMVTVTNQAAHAAMEALYGNSHLLFGTDCPMLSIKRTLSELRDLPLPESALQDILSRNARQLFPRLKSLQIAQ